MFICLNQGDGPIVLNVSHILAFRKYHQEPHTMRYMNGINTVIDMLRGTFYVQETIEEVHNQLKEVVEQR